MNYQKNNLNISLKPSPFLIDNWKYWLAKKVIEDFMYFQPVTVQVDEIYEIFDLTSIISVEDLYQELTEKMQGIMTNIVSIQNLEDSCRSLEKYFFENISNKICNLSQDLTCKYETKLRQYLLKDIQHSSPQHLLRFFDNLLPVIIEKKSNFELQQLDISKQEYSAKQAFFNLKNLSDYHNAWQAYCLYIELKFVLNNKLIQIQILTSLLNLCQNYFNSTKRSLLLLKDIENSLNEKCLIDLISLPVFSYLEVIDSKQQLKLLEIWIGHHVNYWGNAPISWLQIEKKLLENVEALVREICNDFQSYFMKYIDLVDDSSIADRETGN